MAKSLLRFLNDLVTAFVSAVLVLAGLYAGYALWDNQQVYDASEDAVAEMREIRQGAKTGSDNRSGVSIDLTDENLVTDENGWMIAYSGTSPEPTAAEAEPDEILPDLPMLPVMAELKAINPDVTAWLTMDNTAIDYPVLQGRNNNTYINRDVNGEFSMSGSIFLDSRNHADYAETYSLLYGHDMSKHRMFSDVNLYKDQSFFAENTKGTLTLPYEEHTLTTLSVIVTSASDSAIFNPANWKDLTWEKMQEMITTNALYINEEGITKLKALSAPGEEEPGPENGNVQNSMEETESSAEEADIKEEGTDGTQKSCGPHILALSTCSDEFTDARTILLTLIEGEPTVFIKTEAKDITNALWVTGPELKTETLQETESLPETEIFTD